MQLGGKGGAVDYLPPWKTLIFNNPEKSIQSLCSVQPNIYIIKMLLLMLIFLKRFQFVILMILFSTSTLNDHTLENTLESGNTGALS